MEVEELTPLKIIEKALEEALETLFRSWERPMKVPHLHPNLC